MHRLAVLSHLRPLESTTVHPRPLKTSARRGESRLCENTILKIIQEGLRCDGRRCSACVRNNSKYIECSYCCRIRYVVFDKDQHIKSTTTALSRGVRVVIADVELLCCLVQQDTEDTAITKENMVNLPPRTCFNPFS